MVFLLVAGSPSELSAQESFLALEAHSGQVLASFEADQRKPISSLTHIATAKVVLDWARFSRASLTQLASVPTEMEGVTGPNPMGLRAGDQIQLREALYSMLLGSDAVSAQTLASFVGTSIAQRSGGRSTEAFVREMNLLAQSLEMRKTRFFNAHGSDGGRPNLSTAADMARLCVYACRDQGFLFYVKQKARTVSFSRGGSALGFKVRNANPLLGRSGIRGIKSASSPQAGPCLAVTAEKSPAVTALPDGGSLLTQRRLVVVVLRSGDREGRGLSLIQEGWARFEAGRKSGQVVGGQILVPAP